MAVKDWSTTPSVNTAVGSVSIAEGCDPGGLNDAIREVMAAVASQIGFNGIGYTTGQGGSVTQATDKTTTVTLNKLSGRITTANQSMTNGQTIIFNFSNSFIVDGDQVLVTSGPGLSNALFNYRLAAGEVSNGGCRISITNISGGTLAEAIPLNFMVLKGSMS